MSRLEFTAKTKMAAWQRSKGHCEKCTVKIRPGNGPEYDHELEDYYDGGNDLDNCRVLCIGCHKAKTRENAPVIAKSRRLIKKQAKVKSKSRGFLRPDGYKYNWSAGRYEKVI